LAFLFKKTYAFNEKGEIIPVDSYTDEHYDVSLSIDKDGKPKIERIYGTLTLALLIPLFRNLDRSFIAYSPFKSQGIKLTFLTLKSSPVK
jgi:hypothetical protein